MSQFLFYFFNFISILGGEKMMIIATTCISLLTFFWLKEKIFTKFILFNYLITMTIVIVLKFIIEKPRSLESMVLENSYAFPSGHVAAAMITFLLLFYISKLERNNSHKFFMRFFGIIWLLFIISARLYLKVHDIYDVLASILIASYVFYISLNLKIFKKYKIKKDFHKIHKN